MKQGEEIENDKRSAISDWIVREGMSGDVTFEPKTWMKWGKTKWVSGGRVFIIEGKAGIKLPRQKCGWCIPLTSRRKMMHLGGRERTVKWDQRGSQGPEYGKDFGFYLKIMGKPLEGLCKTRFLF